ncbi:T9SS type A sorting domain-containing protein [Geojedonia litorea]|uniref:T9SS type A sorting domain-containing protein n=1 Tax=Geojedonia litorea TaxID=1268269 RepID=A0ABV9N5S2_9FLAO
MLKNYLQFIILFIGLTLTFESYAQNNAVILNAENEIVDLNVYPNPVTNGKLFITTHENLVKTIEIFDVLGKKIFTTRLSGQAIDVSQITSGVYILKITQNNISATRKLVIK